jgi:hypothetical protein
VSDKLKIDDCVVTLLIVNLNGLFLSLAIKYVSIVNNFDNLNGIVAVSIGLKKQKKI